MAAFIAGVTATFATFTDALSIFTTAPISYFVALFFAVKATHIVRGVVMSRRAARKG